MTWGYHPIFHGPLTRADLDRISSARPIIVWHRSAHEFIVNSKALETYGIDAAFVAALPEEAQKQSNLEEGHFWEGGMFGVIPNLLPAIATPDRLRRGLEFVVRYYHANGVTLGCEPGGLFSKQLQDAQNAVLSRPDSPFRFYFIPDGKSEGIDGSVGKKLDRAGHHGRHALAPAEHLLCLADRGIRESRVERHARCGYSLRLENDMGSIVPGKLANFSILDDNPLTVDAAKIKDIHVWGTVQEGRVLPIT